MNKTRSPSKLPFYPFFGGRVPSLKSTTEKRVPRFEPPFSKTNGGFTLENQPFQTKSKQVVLSLEFNDFKRGGGGRLEPAKCKDPSIRKACVHSILHTWHRCSCWKAQKIWVQTPKRERRSDVAPCGALDLTRDTFLGAFTKGHLTGPNPALL